MHKIISLIIIYVLITGYRMAADCIFCKIIGREISSNIIFEDEKIVAFKDVNPQAPVHIVIIPREHINTLNDVTDYTLYSDLFKAIHKLAVEMKIDRERLQGGCELNGDALQSVFHIHFHFFGGKGFPLTPS